MHIATYLLSKFLSYVHHRAYVVAQIMVFSGTRMLEIWTIGTYVYALHVAITYEANV